MMSIATRCAATLLACARPAPVRMAAHDDVRVVADGDGWVVACKPAGVAVHDGEPSLLELLHPLVGHLRAVNRLDRETSGLLLLAKTREAAGELQARLREDGCVKRYCGIVKGSLEPCEGTWDAAISTKAEGRQNPQGKRAERVAARTAYRVTGSSRFLSAVDFELGSGRTHQIRRHAAMSRHHIIGDTRYGPTAHARKIAERYGFAGMALHASLLRVRLDGELRTFHEPTPCAWEPLLAPLREAGELGEPSEHDRDGA